MWEADVVGTTTWATGRACRAADCLQWSEEGILAVVTTGAIHIVTPLVGYARDDAGDAAQASHARAPWSVTSIDAKRELSRMPPVPELADKEIAAATAPGLLGEAWHAAAWSPAGVGPLHTCALATINSRRQLSVYMCEGDARTGPYVSVDVPGGQWADARTGVARTLATQYSAVRWSPVSPQRHAWLAAGTRGGDIVLLDAYEQPLRVVATMRVPQAVYALSWSPWQLDGTVRLAIHTTDHMYVFLLRDELAWEQVGACAIGLAQVSDLHWAAGPVLHWSTPSALVSWSGGTAPPVSVPLDLGAHAAGSDARGTLRDDGRMYTRDGVQIAALPVEQAVWGYARDPSGLVATLTSADETASWRYMISHKLTLTLWLPHDRPLPDASRPPIVAWRAWAYAWERQSDTSALWAPLEARLAKLQAHAEALGQHASLAEWRAAHHEAQCLAWGARVAPASVTHLEGAHELCVWLGLAVRAAAWDAAMPAAYTRRLARALEQGACAKDGAACLQRLGERLAVPHATDVDEVCPACDARMPPELAATARCPAGHLFDRCVVTYAVIDGVRTWTCVGCARQAYVPACEAVSQWLPTMTGCLACGNRWRS